MMRLFYDYFLCMLFICYLLGDTYLDDSDFLSLFFELFVVYKAIIAIICRRKYELLK